MQVSRFRANGLQDKSLHDYNFSNDKGYNPEMQKAHDYVTHWEEMKSNSLGLLLWGDVGTGKSFFGRMHRKCPVGQRCFDSDDQLFQNSEYADRNVF